MEKLRCSVSDFIALTNQTLDFAYPNVEVEGEVSSFKVNQSKYVFFDLKDEGGSIGCFMTVWQLKQPIEDGMKIIVTATPKLTQWGKFSLTVQSIRLVGDGDIKKSFELLVKKLDKEGLFAPERKRQLPVMPDRVGVISSTSAAGYGDFVKIVNSRWPSVNLEVAHVQVQGATAPEQIIKALSYFNELDVPPEVIVIVRGGGSADDLATFSEEPLARAVAGSRVPVLAGIGHESDVSLVDMVADVRASTPSNAAEILVPDKNEIVRELKLKVGSLAPVIGHSIDSRQKHVRQRLEHCIDSIERSYEQKIDSLDRRRSILRELDPRLVLKRGYAITRGDMSPGSDIWIEKNDTITRAKVIDVKAK